MTVASICLGLMVMVFCIHRYQLWQFDKTRKEHEKMCKDMRERIEAYYESSGGLFRFAEARRTDWYWIPSERHGVFVTLVENEEWDCFEKHFGDCSIEGCPEQYSFRVKQEDLCRR